ncbi:MAG TPA: tRNA pseudouridine(55) synthase TruB, partial [Miltoncostaeaceae bacterium]|nr:tRNA pseudouridine(55) synthase TruB [Miltoncostaeaceae bacterium]
MPDDLAAAWLVDKPAGPTSHDVVATVRRNLPRRTRVGHAGTLDPFATGLLVVLAGRATRLAPWLSDLPKGYRATVRLGTRSATGDPEGPLTPGGTLPDPEAVAAAVAAMRGEQRQRVPAHSAVRVEGERLYRRARRGEVVEAPVRSVVVHDIRLVSYDRPAGDAVIEARVSKGTYLRQIAVDLGEALGCGGYCLALRRTSVGTLDVAEAVAPDVAGTVPGVPLRSALAHLPARELDADEERRVGHGIALPAPGAGEGDAVA